MKLWLSGISRKNSAVKARIGDGTVTSIVQEAKENIPDIELLREVAIKIKSKGWDLNIFSSAVRHRDMLYRKGLSDDQIDNMIENVDEYCFKNETTAEDFVSMVENVSIVSSKYGCTVDKLPGLIVEKETLLESLEQKIDSLGKDFEEYRENKPVLAKLREEIHASKGPVMLDILMAKWHVLIPPEHVWAVEEDEVLEAAQLLVKNPYLCTTVTVAPYAPFGLPSISFLPLSSYLIFFGLYSSAISLSQDLQLRQSIRNIAEKDVNLLSSIGTAQMDMEVRRVVGGMKDVINQEETALAQKTGIETPIPQDDMEDYMKLVLEEASKARKKATSK